MNRRGALAYAGARRTFHGRRAAIGLAAAWAASVALVSIATVARPLPASAHALLVAAQPAPGAELSTPPGAVVLIFDEPLAPKLSQATVTDPAGRAVSAAPITATEIRVDLVTALPGTYHVLWTSVSSIDGHLTQGAFDFAVGATASSLSTAAGPQPAPSAALTAVGWIEDAALLLAVGMFSVGWLAARPEPLPWVRLPIEAVVTAAAAAGAARVAVESLTIAGAGGAATFLTSTAAGRLGLARVALEAGALALVLLPPLGSRSLPRLGAVALLLAALVDLAWSGHAATVDGPWLGIALDAAHLTAASVWAGGLAALVFLRPPGGWRGGGRELLARFSRAALPAFAATVVLGVLEAAGTVGTVAALATTAYGRTLLAKIACVAAMVPLSLVAWRRRRPSLRVEATLAAAVVAAAAVLGTFPTPASVAAGEAAAQSLPAANAGLPADGDVTVAGHAGQVLVGVSVRPGRPGANSLTVYVLPVAGGAAASTLSVAAAVDARRLPLEPCGDTCRRGTAALRGGELVSVTVAGAAGGVARVALPPLPAPPGIALWHRALATMAGLRTFVLHETLTGGTPVTITTDYAAHAPDTLTWSQPGGGRSISIGATRYSQASATGAWTVDHGLPPIREPLFSWSAFSHAIAAHVLRSDTVDGVAVTVLGCFAGTPGTPVWFQLAVDGSGMVREALMMAPGHFMDDHFSAFNAQVDVAPPSTP